MPLAGPLGGILSLHPLPLFAPCATLLRITEILPPSLIPNRKEKKNLASLVESERNSQDADLSAETWTVPKSEAISR